MPDPTASPYKLRTRRDLDRAVRDGQQIGASLMAGKTFGSKLEREHAGRTLYALADVLERALKSGFLDPVGMDD